MHASKGLEWPVVFVIRLIEGECPLSDAALEEERRLAYVALTRAKERAFLSYVTVDVCGALADPSRFLASLPAHLVERCQVYG